MNKTIYGAFLAFVSLAVVAACTVVFCASGEAEFAVLAVVFCGGIVGGVAIALEDTKWCEKIVGMFAGEEDER